MPLDSRSYRRAVAEIIVEAAQRSIVPAEVRITGRPANAKIAVLSTMAGAQMLVNALVLTDHDAARWLAVSSLSPEINVCIGWLRRIERIEAAWQESEAELERLRTKALTDLAAGRQRPGIAVIS